MKDNYAALLLLKQGLPPVSDIRKWKGTFLIPDVFADIPYGDNKRIWTPAFGIYSDLWQDRIIWEFQRRKYTHFPYNCAGWLYHDDYGYLSDDPAACRKDLLKLRRAGLIPVVAACDDQDGGSLTPWKSFTANADLIPIAFPAWECNGPYGVAERQPDGSYTGRLIDCIKNTRAVAPNSDLYLHFTAGHGAPGYPDERASWRYVRDNYHVLGLLSQDEGYVRDPIEGDPVGTAAGLQDTAERLEQEGLLNVAFEQCTYPTYNHEPGWDESHQLRYGKYLIDHAPSIAGFCDGAAI